MHKAKSIGLFIVQIAYAQCLVQHIYWINLVRTKIHNILKLCAIEYNFTSKNSNTKCCYLFTVAHDRRSIICPSTVNGSRYKSIVNHTTRRGVSHNLLPHKKPKWDFDCFLKEHHLWAFPVFNRNIGDFIGDVGAEMRKW